MNDLSDTAPPKRRRASRKAAKPVDAPTDAPAEAAVRAILDHALQPDAEGHAEAEVESALAEASSNVGPQAGAKAASDPAPAKSSRRGPRKRGKSAKRQAAALAQSRPADAPGESAAAVEAAHGLAAIASVEVVEAPEIVDGEALAHNEVQFPQGVSADVRPSAGQPMENAPAEADQDGSEPYGSEPRLFEPHPSELHPSEPHHSESPPPERHDPDQYHNQHYRHAEDDLPHSDGVPPGGHDDPPPAAPPPPPQSHHHWVYLGLGVFLLALGFGVWGAWAVFFSGGDASGQSAAALSARTEKLSQEVSTLRRSDQISRDANRDLERTLAERDEEIAGLRADIAFYESFVGATGQRRGLSVHDLDMQLQGGDAWHFVATLTQNLNRGAVNTGRVTLSIEGTRDDRLEKLSWSGLRKQGNAPGVPYSFKYFQQVEGEVMLPKGFKPLRVGVRLVPAGGAAVEQSFPWPDTVRSDEAG